MDLIQKYILKHHAHMIQVFNAMGKENKLQATKVFSFMQNSFDQQQFRFQMNGNNFFADDQNATVMEKLLQSYYRLNQVDQTKKFYLYRIQFSLQQISQILKFWLERQPNLTITYIQNTGTSNVGRGTIKLSKDLAVQDNKQDQPNQVKINSDNLNNQQNNQFDIDEQKIPDILAGYQQSVKQYEEQLNQTENQQKKNQLRNKIQQIKLKIKVLEQQMKTNKQTKINRKLGQRSLTSSIDQYKKNKQSPKSTKKGNINYKLIFQFYAKQTHLTGVKATFQRIQHQSQSLNYQKLVHFLRQYNIMPQSAADKKKIHNLYVKNCQHTRDLNLQGFINVVQGVSDILFKQSSKEQRIQLLKDKISQKNGKNNKILNNPFHSLQKQDFRIDKNDLNYNFKLKPQDGKFVNQVTESIQKRRKDKSEAKTQRFMIKQQKDLRFLKKLQAIDPFNPLVLRNHKLLQPKPQQYEPIASLQNMQHYRDHSFNFQNHFGIDLPNSQKPQGDNKSSKRYSPSKKSQVQGYKKGQQMLKRVSRLQKQQQQKMKSLMSGIIQRTDAKMKKMGISPDKRQKSVRYS